MVGYLSKFCFAELCILTDEPDFSDIEVAEYDWSKSIPLVDPLSQPDAA
jgi:hypothetical protein